MTEDGINFDVGSGVSLFDGKPFVKIIFGGTSEIMRPDKAREIAVMLFESAIEAERDAAMVYGFKHTAGFDTDDAAAVLMLIREHRSRFEGLEE